MQIPQRRAQKMKKSDDDSLLYLTPEGIRRLELRLKELEQQHPEAVEDVVRTGQLGDFSENAEYQEAKFRLRKINDQIFSIKEKLKHVRVIEEGSSDGSVQLGSTVTVQVGGKERTYQIVGPSEVHPSQGRISHLSPLGSALIGHVVGDTIALKMENSEVLYQIIHIE